MIAMIDDLDLRNVRRGRRERRMVATLAGWRNGAVVLCCFDSGQSRNGSYSYILRIGSVLVRKGSVRYLHYLASLTEAPETGCDRICIVSVCLDRCN